MKLMSLIDKQNVTYFKEIAILKRLNNEFVIRYFDHFHVDLYCSCIITEYCEVF